MSINRFHREETYMNEQDQITNKVVQDIISSEPAKPQINPLLAKLRIPPEILRLPSGGLLYTNGELKEAVKNGELEFYPFTALDELDLKSPDLMLDGKAIERVISRCVPGVQQPLELFARDLDFIMLVLKKVSYGNDFLIKHKHTCENAKEQEYNVPLTNVIKQAKTIDPTTLSNKYTVELANDHTKYTVTLRPLRVKHAIDLIQNFDKMETEEERRRNLFAIFLFSIHDIDGVTDLKMILELLQQLPSYWIEKISEKIEEISNWGVPYTYKTKCKDCNEEIELMVNVNPLTFFI